MRPRDYSIAGPSNAAAVAAGLANSASILTALPSAAPKPLTLIRHAYNRIDTVTAELVPPSERQRVVAESQLILAGYGGVIAWCIAIQSILPLMLIGLPAIYGGWLTVFFSMLQHTGLREGRIVASLIRKVD